MPLKFYFKWLGLLAPWIIHFFLYCGIAPISDPSTAIKNSWGTLGRIAAKAVRAFWNYSGSGISARNCSQPTLNIYHIPTAISPRLRRSWSIESFGNPPVLSILLHCVLVLLLFLLFLGHLKLARSSQSSVEQPQIRALFLDTSPQLGIWALSKAKEAPW